METNYIIILDYSAGEVIKIKLTKEQIRESEKFDDIKCYLSTLEGKYRFRLSDCHWMVVKKIKERSYGFE